jgi:hypothetical protein
MEYVRTCCNGFSNGNRYVTDLRVFQISKSLSYKVSSPPHLLLAQEVVVDIIQQTDVLLYSLSLKLPTFIKQRTIILLLHDDELLLSLVSSLVGVDTSGVRLFRL